MDKGPGWNFGDYNLRMDTPTSDGPRFHPVAGGGSGGGDPGAGGGASPGSGTSEDGTDPPPDDGPAPLSNGGSGAGTPPSVEGFETGRLLGMGGGSSVWLVTAHDGGGVFALKVRCGEQPGQPGADPDRRETGVAVATVRREVDVVGGLRHEHLVAIHGIVATDRGPGALMDYAPGGSLQNLVAVRGPLPIGEAVTVLVPIAQALAHLHGHGAAHGDVTPSNILFTEEGKPLLSDFELGLRLGEERRLTAGTPGFTDPRAADPECLNTGADVFALGAVAWFALTGRVPGPTAPRPPLSVLVPEIPPRFLDLIEAALSEDPVQRPDAVSFARGTLRAGTAVPVGLVEAVGEDVRPRLLTRRDAASTTRRRSLPGRTGAGGRRLRRSGARAAIGSGRGRAGAQASGATADPRAEPPRRRAAAAGTGRRSAGRRRPGSSPGLIGARIPVWIAAGALAVLLAAGAVWVQLAGESARLSESVPEAVADRASEVPGPLPGRLPPGAAPEPNPREGAPPGEGQAPREGPVPREGRASGEGPAPAGEIPQSPEPPMSAGGPDRPPRTETGRPAGTAGATDASSPPGVPKQPGTPAPGTGSVVDPVEALTQLAQRRATAFADADPALLGEVNAPGSPAMAEDHRDVTALAESGRRLAGLRLTVIEARAVPPASLPSASLPPASLPSASLPPGAGTPSAAGAPRAAAVAATVEVSAHTELDSSGGTVSAEVPPRRQELVFVLREEGGWKIHSVYAAAPDR